MATIEETQALAVRHYQAGELRQAEQLCRQILHVRPNDPAAIHFLGVIASAAGRIDAALQLIQQSIVMQPSNAQFHANFGSILRNAGKMDDALISYQNAVRLNPDCAEAHAGIANICQERGDIARSQAHCHAAMRLNPNLADIWNVQGNLLRMQGRYEEAAAHFRKSTELNPQLAYAHNNLACSLMMLGRKREALESYRKTLTLAPGYAEAHSNIGVLLQEQGRLDEAAAHLRQAVRLQPALANAQNNLGGVLQLQSKLDEAIVCFRAADKLAPADPTALTNILLCLNYDPTVDAATLVAEHRQWGQRFGKAEKTAPTFGPAKDHDRDPNRPLRVGYVSPDFRAHAMANFLEPILASHHADQFQAICYAEVSAPDATTDRLRKLAHAWRSTVGVSDTAMADQIRADRIDILIDLAGHTSASRLRTFRFKPAPIQATYLGYPSTTGVETVDYCLTDAIVDPPGEPPAHVEQLFRLPSSFCCYTPASEMPDVGPLPAERAGFITFGSLHVLQRLNSSVLDTWCDLLRAVPTSRLLIFRDSLRGQVRDDLLRQIAQRGIPASRVDLEHAVQSPGGFAGVYHRVDISLDTFPWSGHTTACQSLWMGVPVVTLRGNRHAGRMVASVLHHAGFPEWIAGTGEEYVEIAVNLAGDIPTLARLRAVMRERVAGSVLCDRVGFARDLEEGYREIWRRWCRRTGK